MKVVATLPIKETLYRSLRVSKNRSIVIEGKRFSIANLTTFAIHGCKCVRCGREGNQLLAWIDNGGGHHVDLFSVNPAEKFHPKHVLMNRDHIIPKSKHGGNTNWNYQPMCVKCNSKKGNNECARDKKLSLFRNHWKKIYMRTHEFFTRYVLRHLHKHPALYSFGQTVREVHLHKITFVLAKFTSPFATLESHGRVI
jgi:5-methylcytosine-specific restriction endonuclease McrA